MPTLPTLTPRRRWLALSGLLGLAPLLQACSPLRLINATVSTDTHTVLSDQDYGPLPRQQLDVYRPADAPPGAPLAVFFYGGSWSSGDRADYRFVGEALASRGIVTVVADYRLSPEVSYPAFLEDCALAVKWAHDNARRLGASPRRIHTVGHSAGAYNAAMMALDPRWLGGVGLRPQVLAGWAGLAGPYDFLPIGLSDVKKAFNWPDTPPDSQPLFHVKAGPPVPSQRVLLLAARSDILVNPQRNTVAMAEALQARGAPVEVELFDRVSHTTLIGAMARPLRGLAPVLDRLSGFLQVPAG
ncbi:alpha/beta hydrolase [Hydrogenophaga sp. R2]|uniref:alpha/beta hydrolase n=1 Tax=Hydrogenophaga sp. R2 TaxID=3132827 RepID=UPI003CF07B38